MRGVELDRELDTRMLDPARGYGSWRWVGEGLPGGLDALATGCAMEASCSMAMVGCVVVIMGAADGLFGCLDRRGGGRSSRRWVRHCWKEGGGGGWSCFPPLLAGISLFVVSGVGFPLATLCIWDASVPPAFSTLSRAIEERLSVGVALPVLLSKRW